MAWPRSESTLLQVCNVSLKCCKKIKLWPVIQRASLGNCNMPCRLDITLITVKSILGGKEV